MELDIAKLKAVAQEIARDNGLDLIVLFGSRATGTTHRRSDVDIAYVAREPLSLSQESALIVEFMRLFRTDAVDLVSLRNASPLLRYQVARFGKAIYERTPGLFISFYINALRQHQEARPLFQLRSHYLDKKIAKMKA